MNTSAPSKNVVWIFGDQHRAQALSCSGDPNVSTPSIDRMATEGMRFTQAVAGYPLCCPFRGSLLTGRYPHHCVPGHEHQMPHTMPTIAHAFREHGYHTAWFGKWHLDGFEERNGRAAMHIVPPNRRGGFDTWCGYDNNNSQWDSWVHGGAGDSAFHERLPGYETDALTDMLIQYLHDRADKRNRVEDARFFAALSVQPPHDPYVAPAQWMQRHNPATITLRPNVPSVSRVEQTARRDLAGYYAMIENLDWNLGRIRSALAECGLENDTHILFFSDHGDMHGSHGQFRKTIPYEESIRIPFVLGGLRPRYAAHTGDVDCLINHVDIAPTTLGLCGIDPPEWMEGTDFSGYRMPKCPQPPLPDSAFLQNITPTGHPNSINRPWRGVVTHNGWKYVVLENQPWLLFNLNEDPFEQVNLAFNNGFQTQRRRLHERLRQWIEQTEDRFEVPAV